VFFVRRRIALNRLFLFTLKRSSACTVNEMCCDMNTWFRKSPATLDSATCPSASRLSAMAVKNLSKRTGIQSVRKQGIQLPETDVRTRPIDLDEQRRKYGLASEECVGARRTSDDDI
jgi:hypothetical protein